MDVASAKKLLDILIENALRILSAGFGVDSAESSFFDIVGLLRREIALKGYFLEKVHTMFSMPDPGRLDAGMVPKEIIELVAHELRWNELRDLADKRIEDYFRGDAARAIGDIAHNIAAAYDDNWADREFYESYRQ